MYKFTCVLLLLLFPLMAWSKSPSVQESCKQIMALASEEGILHVIEHIKKCYADSNTVIANNKQKTLTCAAKHITAIHLDSGVTSILGYPPTPYLSNEEGSIKIHHQLLQSGISGNEAESVEIMSKLNKQVKACLR
ncbi:hypothetical protein EV673_0371 [Limnobacter thiooxidans]|nr:hypothetical protein EV673_0371 [Limnobacter thiooxidans]